MSTKPVRKVEAGPPTGEAEALYALGQDINFLVDRTADIVSAFEFIPPSAHASIQAGTNTADLTSYLVAARDAAHGASDGKGAVVILPGGTYKANLSVLTSAGINVTWRGAGRRATKLVPAVDAPVFTFDSSTGPIISCRVEDLMMEAPAGFTSPAFSFTGTGINDHHLFSRLFVRGFRRAFNVLGRLNWSWLRDVEIYEDLDSGIYIDTSGTVGLGFENVSVLHGAGYGLYAKSLAVDDNMILRLACGDLNSEGNAKGGIHIENADQFSLSPGAYIENNGGHGVELAGTISRAFDIRGIRSWGNAGDAVRVTTTLATGYVGGNMLSANGAPAAWNVGTTYNGPVSVTYGGVTYWTKHTGNVGHQPDISPTWWVATTLDDAARSTVHIETSHAESKVTLAPNWEGGTATHTIVKDVSGNTHVGYTGVMGGALSTETSTTPNVQGKTVLQVTGGPTITHLLAGDPGQVVVIHAQGSAATLTHNAGGAGSIYSMTGANITVAPDHPVLLWCQETRWMQIGLTPVNPEFSGSLVVRNAGSAPTVWFNTTGTGFLFSVLKDGNEVISVGNDEITDFFGPIRPNLPTSAGAAGTLWNDNGVVKVA